MTPFAELCNRVTFSALPFDTEAKNHNQASYDINLAYQGHTFPPTLMTFIGMDVPPNCLLVLSHWLEKAEEVRHASSYSDWWLSSDLDGEETEEAYQEAGKLLQDLRELLGDDYERFTDALADPRVRFEVLCSEVGLEATLDATSMVKDQPVWFPAGAFEVSLRHQGKQMPAHRFGWHEPPTVADVLSGWFGIVEEVQGRDYPAWLRHLADNPALTEWYGDEVPEDVLRAQYSARVALLEDLKALLGTNYQQFWEAWKE